MVRFEICGHVGRDPEPFGTEPNIAVRFSVAHTFPSFTTERGQVVPESTTWLNIVAWGSLGRAALKHVHKGDKVFVAGTIRQKEVINADNSKSVYYDYEAREIEFMSRTTPATSTDIQA